MNLCFLQCEPSKELFQVLLKHFNVSKFQSLNTLLEDKAPKDLIAVKVTKEEDLLKASKVRSLYPSAWIALVVDKSMLNSKMHSNLVNFEDKNDVWLDQEWESIIWFSIERWFQYQKLTQENLRLRKNLNSLNKKTEALVSRFEHNLSVVENIQRALKPKSKSVLSGIQISAKYIPALGKGGDYYDIFEYSDNKRIGILLADASTHSMAAALLSVLFNLKKDDFTSRFQTSRQFVSHLCDELELAHAKSLAPMSFFYGILDRNSLSFDFTTAGQIAPMIWRSQKQLSYKNTQNPKLGTCACFPYREVKLNLSPGDLVVLHTDGLNAPLEQKGKHAQEVLTSLLKRNADGDPITLRNDFLGLIDSYRYKKRIKDDLTFLNLSIDKRTMYLAK